MMSADLLSVQFTETELQQLDTALQTIQTVLNNKTVTLTPEQGLLYGNMAEQYKPFVDKARQYMNQNPECLPSFLDMTELNNVFNACKQIEKHMVNLGCMVEQLSDAWKLMRLNNYFGALNFYRNLILLSEENLPGTTIIYEDMKRVFCSVKRETAPAFGQFCPPFERYDLSYNVD